MEQKNKIEFSVICNKLEYLTETLEWYNAQHNTDFRVSEFILDEVNFARVQVARYKPEDIFNIGYVFGVKEEKLRQKGEIDW